MSKEAEIQRIYSNLFTTDDGIAVLDDLMDTFYIRGPIPPNANAIFCEGARNVVLYILACSNKQLKAE